MSSGSQRRRGEDLAPALFPFMAVMLCTIGALVFVLTIAVSQASQAAKSQLAEARERRQLHEDLAAMATDELLAQRAAAREALDRASAALTRLEDRIVSLQDELREAIEQAEAIDDRGESADAGDASREAKIASLRGEIASLQAEIDAEVQEQKTSKPAFCIIPYDGPNGTARRPVYLECTAEGVTLQPEGLHLSMNDLRPPYGPGNPLDACLRMVRARLQEHDGSSFAASPYPLLLVRPDGIAAYAAARSAIAAWDDQYGYELVEAEMPLTFPPSMPGLRGQLEDTLARSRVRQTEILASLPRHLNTVEDWSGEPMDVAVLRGDEAPAGSTRQLAAGERFIPVAEAGFDSWTSPPPTPLGRPAAGTSGSGGSPPGGNSPGLAPPPGGMSPEYFDSRMQGVVTRASPLRGDAAGGDDGASGFAPPPSGASSGSTGELTTGRGSGMSGGGNSSEAVDVAGGRGGMTATQAFAASQESSGGPSGTTSAAPSGSAAASGQPGGGTGAAAASANGSMADPNQNPTEARPTQPPGRNAAPAAQTASHSRQAAGGGHGPQGGKTNRTAIANQHGQGWAVSRQRLSSTPVRRVIEVRVMPDRWVIMDSNARAEVAAEIVLADGPRKCGERLREAIRGQVDSWGVAIADGYWVPVVQMSAAADASWSLEQLHAMLEGSGVELRTAL